MEYRRWRRLMTRLSLPAHEATFESLLSAYAQAQRAYHNTQHVDAVLAHLDQTAHLTTRADELELALWFHDAVYDPFSSSNETDSAAWARRFLEENQRAGDLAHRVTALILATCHDAAPQDPDQALMVDIDLAILGADEGAYDHYESGVRREYKRVPRFIYNRKRRQILQAFLQRERIYTTAYFHERYEESARHNLKQAISRL